MCWFSSAPTSLPIEPSGPGPPTVAAARERSDVSRWASERSHSWGDLLAVAGFELASLADTRVLGNSFALLEGVRAGLGITLLPRYLVAEQINIGRLVEVPLADAKPAATGFYLSYYPSVTARLWAALLLECLATADAV